MREEDNARSGQHLHFLSALRNFLKEVPTHQRTLLKRKDKEDLEEDVDDDDSEGGIGQVPTYSSASCCRLIRV